MTGLPARILALAQVSVRDPRQAVRLLLAEDVPIPARTAGLLLMAVLSAILLQPGFALLPPPEDVIGQFLVQSPLQTAVLQWFILILSALLIYRVGRAFNGVGTLADALLLVVWLQLLMLGVQVAQLLALILVPPLSGLLGLAGFILFLWLLVNFIAELHGFRSLGAVFAGVVVTFFLAAFVVAILLGLFLGPEVLRNV
jgi:Yip1 domain